MKELGYGDLEESEIVDAGFLVDTVDGTKQHFGRLARTADGHIHVVLIRRSTRRPHGITIAGEQKGDTWLFFGEAEQYLLVGVRGSLFTRKTSRPDLRGGHESFLHQHLTVDAAFKVSETSLLGQPDDLPPVTPEPKFDALSIASDELGMWVGLELPERDEYPPQRLVRKDHARCQSVVGGLSIGSEGQGDLFGETWHHKDMVTVKCGEPKSLESMYRLGCVVHDFINITVARVVPVDFVLYTESEHDENRRRRFDLMPQGPRFRADEPSRQWGVLLTLADAGGLPALAKLIQWCEADELNRTILARVTHQKRGTEAFIHHWRTLNMLYGGDQSEHVRFIKLLDDVGKNAAKTIRPDGVSFEEWARAIANYRNVIDTHPTGREPDDYRLVREGPVFTNHMEFLLKALVLKRGLGVSLAKSRVVEGLRMVINDWGKSAWDWRTTKGEHHYIY